MVDSKTVFAVCLIGLSFVVGGLSYSDSSVKTENELEAPLTFVGNTVNLTEAEADKQYNLTKNGGTFRSFYGNSLIDTPGLEQARYLLNDTNSTDTQTEIDIVSNYTDVVGRINASKSEVEIEVLEWLNGSELDSKQYSVSMSSWPTTDGSETLYRLNVSKPRYWVKVKDSDSGNLKVEPARFRSQRKKSVNP